MPTVLKSGSLNLLEPSGPVQACNGIALPFYLYVQLQIHHIPLHFGIHNAPMTEKQFNFEAQLCRFANAINLSWHMVALVKVYHHF